MWPHQVLIHIIDLLLVPHPQSLVPVSRSYSITELHHPLHHHHLLALGQTSVATGKVLMEMDMDGVMLQLVVQALKR